MKRTLSVILAGGEGARLTILSSQRAKPAVPFGGKYRIIDFALSNIVNSGGDNVVVLTQYNPRSLNDHIGMGRPWDLDRTSGGIRILQPYIAQGRIAIWYRGTADAVYQNLRSVEQAPGDCVLVLAGDHVYKMDYQPFVNLHRRRRADVTIAVRRVPMAEASRMGILAVDEHGRVTEWQEKPKQPQSDLASMGIYVFSKRALRDWLSESRPDFGGDVIPAMLDGGARVFAYRFDGYWQDVGTIGSYWQTNLELLEESPALDMYDREWLIHTRSEERAPAKVGRTAMVVRSLISHGCVVDGTVVNSVLSPGVRVEQGAVVRDSIVMFDAVVRTGAIVDQSILDKEVVVGAGAIVGDGPIPAPANRKEPNALTTGITVVGKRAVVPRSHRIGRNVRIDPDVKTSDYPSRVVPAGETIAHVEPRLARRRAAKRIEQTAQAALAAVVAEVSAVDGVLPTVQGPAKSDTAKGAVSRPAVAKPSLPPPASTRPEAARAPATRTSSDPPSPAARPRR